MEKIKKKKVGVAYIIVNTLVVLIVLTTLVVILFRTSILGITFYGVRSDSMDGGYGAETDGQGNYYPPSFKKGDLIVVDNISGKEKSELKVGQVITFKTLKNNQSVLNTHRIVMVIKNSDTGVVIYITAGDGELVKYNGKTDSITDYLNQVDGVYGYDPLPVNPSDIVGVYKSKVSNAGKLILFAQSKTGFLTLVVFPCVIIMFYFGYLFIYSLLGYRRVKYELTETERTAAYQEKMNEQLNILEQEKQKEIEALREKLRAEILAEELNKTDNKAKNDVSSDGETTNKD